MMKSELEKKTSIRKTSRKQLSEPNLTLLTHDPRYKIRITPLKEKRKKSQSAQGLIT
jgi:hypothetical protein